MTVLRCLTYLAPSLPSELFYLITRTIGEQLGVECSLDFETRISGPRIDELDDPFTRGEIDIGFMCAPAYQWIRDRDPSPIVLVPAAPLFEHALEPERPCYYSEVLVRKEHSARTIEDLTGALWAYNDPCSWSGYHSVCQRFGPKASELRMEASGSHLNSLSWILSGKVEVAAVDSNVLTFAQRRDPHLAEHTRIVESLGPFPIQPLVMRREMAPEWLEAVAEVLRRMDRDPGLSREMGQYFLRGFAEVSESDYR